MSDALIDLAEAAGLLTRWRDYRGQPQTVAPSTLRAILEAMELPCASAAQVRDSHARLTRGAPLPGLITALVREQVRLPRQHFKAGDELELVYENGEVAEPTVEVDERGPHLPALAHTGYHRLRLRDREVVLAVAPPHGTTVQELTPGRRLWGVAAQLYSLRRAGDGGIGDFTALSALARRAAAASADAVAVSPVHALFSADVERFSPYAPSSRLFLNALHVDPAALIGERAHRGIVDALGIAPELQRLEALALVDWPAAARLRLLVLRTLFDELKGEALAAGRALHADFARFRAQRGEALEDHARFEALHAHQLRHGNPGHWRDWPGGLDDARSNAVRDFAQAHADDVAFHAFLQWLADAGLAQAQAAARGAGMTIGLIGDLAVGTDGAGSHAWSRRHDFLERLSVGAPPDEINQQGQSWGLTTFSPRALIDHGYAPFVEMLRAALRHAGGVRIDHVLGLNRLWLVPEGATATDGAYLRYPLADLLRLIALESARHRALIIGEDLGTVPEGFRETLAEAGVMGMRVLWFEREYGLFRDPLRWSPSAVAMPDTHDLPTVAGWWKGHDIDWRIKVGQSPQESGSAEHARRDDERRALWAACEYAGAAQGALPSAEEAPRAIEASLRFVARTPSLLAIVPLEDFAAADEQPNLPGTVTEHPNWRRRMPADVDALFDRGDVRSRLELLRTERGR